MPAFTPLTEAPPGLAGAGRWCVVRPTEPAELLVTPDGDLPGGGPEVAAVAAGAEPTFVGVWDGGAGPEGVWAVGAAEGAEAPDPLRWQPLRALWPTLGADLWAVAGRAVQLVAWRATHRFCGRCATPTVRADGGRALRCPACGLAAYPRLAPAVIVLVRRGAQGLLAQGARWRGRMHSTLAGFVEPGETLEQAVAREVHEEVGVHVGRVRYVASQPWPFPHSLMVGFTAEWEAGELRPDGEEIIGAAWWDATDLPPIPPPPSIARRLIDDWVVEVTGRPAP